MKIKFSSTSLFMAVLLISINIYAQGKGYFVEPVNGLDTNPGTISQPFQSLTKAAGIVAAGDTIYLRGGKYSLSSTISLSKSGTSANFICVFAYKGEKPVFDFTKQTSSDGIKVNGNYWYLKGIESSYSAHNGIAVNGSYNLIENCSVHDNRNTGMQFGNGASYNRVINCDSYYNYDPPLGGNADGFSPKLDVGTENYFYGCRSWQNSDDGWDGYLRPADNVTTTIENCWSFMNGYLKSGEQITTGNGNGFKMGGGDSSNKDSLRHNVTLKNCLCFDNRVKGYDQNNDRGTMIILNCTGFRNGSYNFSIPGKFRATSIAQIKNCISLASPGVTFISAVDQTSNSWNSPFTVSEADFLSIDTTGVRGPRKPDGSLPDLKFMHLTPTSKLIDAGINLGLPYNGKAPDLGAFETGSSTDMTIENEIPLGYSLSQNYPNPFNPNTVISYRISAFSKVILKVYDVLGNEISTLVDEYKSPGNYSALFVSYSTLASGVYYYTLRAGDFWETKKMILLK